MEKHFLAECVEGSPEFRPEPWYNAHGDCIIYQVADEAVVAERIDPVLTIYRSAIDGRPIGFQIKSVRGLIEKFGWEGLCVASETREGRITSISIAALLLAAYEDGEKTIRRRSAYAEVMQCPPEKGQIDRDHFVPA